MKKKKAQAWGFDLIIAATIFVAGMVMIYLYTLNYPSQEEDTIQTLKHQGETFSESLLSDGSPTAWTLTDVVRPGILSEGKIDQTKLELFDNLVTSDYNRTRSLFRLKDNFYIEFQENITLNGIVKGGIGIVPTGEENLAKITRIVIYEGNLTSLNFYIWD
jgi:hypothetical protein